MPFCVVHANNLFELSVEDLKELEHVVEKDLSYDFIAKEFEVGIPQQPGFILRSIGAISKNTFLFLQLVLLARLIGIDLDESDSMVIRVAKVILPAPFLYLAYFGITKLVDRAALIIKIIKLEKFLKKWPTIKLQVPEPLHPVFDSLHENFKSNGSMQLSLSFNELHSLINTLHSFIALQLLAQQSVTPAQTQDEK